MKIKLNPYHPPITKQYVLFYGSMVEPNIPFECIQKKTFSILQQVKHDTLIRLSCSNRLFMSLFSLFRVQVENFT